MTNLILRDNLFEDLFDVRREFDKVFNRMLTVKPNLKNETTPWAGFDFLPAMEAYVDKDGKMYFCKLALPGIEPKEIVINVQGNVLTITGERKLTFNKKEVDYQYQEFTYGKFERALELPEGVMAEKMNAEYKNGLLEITAPMAVAALPKKIEVKTVPVGKPATA